MKNSFYLLLLSIGFIFCEVPKKVSILEPSSLKEQLQIKTFHKNCSIRAITAIDKNSMWYGGSNGQFGYTEDGGHSWHIDSIQSIKKADLEFRGIVKTTDAVFLLAIGSPALLFKTVDKGKIGQLFMKSTTQLLFMMLLHFGTLKMVLQWATQRMVVCPLF